MSATRPRRRCAATLAAAALLLTACRDPDLSQPPQKATEEATAPAPAPQTDGPAAVVVDPRDAILDLAAHDLLATLTDAQSGFDILARVTSLEDAQPAVRRLLAVLAADPRWLTLDEDEDGEIDALGVRPLLPGPLSSREETIDYGDAFTAVLNAGRDAGAAGADFIDLLRDPIVADLGSWQRDTQGMLDAIEAAVQSVGSVAQAEQAVAEIPGEGPRALAWALLASSARDLETLQAYGERGSVHVQLMLDALQPLLATGATNE